jgi:hypothetical protein
VPKGKKRDTLLHVLHVLDLVMVSEPICCDVSKTDLPLINEDIHHHALELVVTMSFVLVSSRNLILGNAISVCSILHCKMLNGFFYVMVQDVDAAVSSFYSVLNDVFQQYVPLKRPKANGYPTFFDSNVIKRLKLKNAARKR